MDQAKHRRTQARLCPQSRSILKQNELPYHGGSKYARFLAGGREQGPIIKNRFRERHIPGVKAPQAHIHEPDVTSSLKRKSGGKDFQIV
jgi:hypothetical protein